jgi:hypothetical protein
MKRKVTSDAVVNFDNARPWVEALFREDPDDVIKRALAAEPAIMSVAAAVGKKTVEQLERNGASEQVLSFVLSQVCFAGAVSIELMRKGNSLLFDDLIVSDASSKKGADDERR